MEDELPYEAAEKLLQWAKDGLPVVFVNNASEIVANNDVTKDNTVAAGTTGSNDGNEEALEEIVKEMKTLSNVKTVEAESDAYEALQELGVYPRVQYKEANAKLLPVMRSAENVDYLYLYHYMYEDEENYEGDVSLDGNYEPYVLDTWSGDVDNVQNVSYESGRTVIHVDLAPGETMVLALKHSEGELDNVVEDTEKAEERPAEEIAENTEENVTEDTTMSEKTEENGEQNLPQDGAEKDLSLTDWALVVDSYEPGEKITRTEENEDTGVTTTEATYTTNHVEIDVGTLSELISWKDIDKIGEKVSGTGTYTTTFTLPEKWSDTGKIQFQADSFQGGTAAVWINDTKVPVNMDRRTADLTPYVQLGENTITVRVTSSLRNVMIVQGYEAGWVFGAPEPDDYGMTGETKLLYTE